MAESVGTRRRQRWAERENRRRETDYRLRHERWSRIDAVLARWLDIARTFGGYEAGASVPPEVGLKRNERVFGSFSDAALVEVNRATGVFGPATAHHFSALSEAESQAASTATTPPVTSGEPRIKEHGHLILTSTRVIFRGATRNREWRFDALVGIEHVVGQPLTLIHVSSRKKVSGFAVAADLAAELRFLLTLGLAHFRGDVGGFVRALETDRAGHRALQPVRPPPVGAEQAPGGPAEVAGAIGHFYFGRAGQSGRRRLAQATVTILGTLLLIGLVAPDTVRAAGRPNRLAGASDSDHRGASLHGESDTIPERLPSDCDSDRAANDGADHRRPTGPDGQSHHAASSSTRTACPSIVWRANKSVRVQLLRSRRLNLRPEAGHLHLLRLHRQLR